MSASRRLCAVLLIAVLLGAASGCGHTASAGNDSRAAADRLAASAAERVRKAADHKRASDIKKWDAALHGRITDRRLFLLSDSVILGAQAALPSAMPTWRVKLDGQESRFFQAGLDVLRARRKEIGQVVVIQMGNNYGGDRALFRSQIDRAMTILSGVRWVLFLTVFEYRSQQAEVNDELRAAATRYRNVRIADWNAYEHQNPGHTSRDGLHLKPLGVVLMAGFIARAVNGLPGA